MVIFGLFGTGRDVYVRYRQADRRGKQGILDEFWANTRYHREYALQLLNGHRQVGYGPGALRRNHGSGEIHCNVGGICTVGVCSVHTLFAGHGEAEQ
jgi:hypothetical protein